MLFRISTEILVELPQGSTGLWYVCCRIPHAASGWCTRSDLQPDASMLAARTEGSAKVQQRLRSALRDSWKRRINKINVPIAVVY